MLRKNICLIGLAIVLLLAFAPAITSASSVEVRWKAHNVYINILMHRYRPSSTSGWATEEFSSLLHKAEFSVGDIFLDFDYSLTISGVITSVNSSYMDIASIIHQQYGKWFRGVRVSEFTINGSDISAIFNTHTFGMKTHIDNTWVIGTTASFNASSCELTAVRLYQHYLTRGTPDESDDIMDVEYYAILDAVLSDSANITLLSEYIGHSIWQGNETLAFDLYANDINALIDVEDFPIIHMYMDVGHLYGEIIHPR